MRVSQPLMVALPPGGVAFAESIHATDFRMSERSDPFHKLIYVLAGRVSYRATVGTALQNAEAGDLISVLSGTAHLLTDTVSSTLLLLCLDDAFLDGDRELRPLWSQLAHQAITRFRLGRLEQQRLQELWRRALLERNHPRPGAELAIRLIATQTIIHLARLPARSTRDDTAERIAAVIREVSQTFYEPWTLDRAATQAGLSRRRFSELFRAATGDTFLDHLIARRLTHATELLRTGEHSILGVVFSCGFGDLSNFYRLFRKRHGHPPSEWMRQHHRAHHPSRPRART